MSMLIRTLLFLFLSLQVHSYTLTEDSPELLEALRDCQNLSFLELPAFPGKTTGPKFKMHYWLSQPLNPQLKTLVLIPGGPGQTFHKLEWAKFKNINLVYFDPRGMGCSTPLQNNLINNPEFYSSRHTAYDLDQLRKYLGLKKWAVYGHSFGTVPATVYASLFPQNIEVLLLEGIVHKGGADFWYSAARKKLIEKTIKQLPPTYQQKILSPEPYNINSMWFSQALLDSLPQGFDKEIFLKRVDSSLKSHLKSSFTYVPHEREDLTPYFSRNAHLILSCKELGADLYSPTRLFIFDGVGFNNFKEHSYKDICTEWPIKKDLFSAEKFPIKVPTFYFQGEYDYLTLWEDAQSHFKLNKSSTKFFLTLKSGGHNPLSLSLNEFNAKNPLQPIYQELIENIIQHKIIPQPLLEKSKALKQEWIFIPNLTNFKQ